MFHYKLCYQASYKVEESFFDKSFTLPILLKNELDLVSQLLNL